MENKTNIEESYARQNLKTIQFTYQIKTIQPLPKPSPNLDPKQIGELIVKSLSGPLTLDEEIELTEWISASKKNEKIFFKLQNELLKSLGDEYIEGNKNQKNKISKQRLYNSFLKNKSIAIAASLFLIASAIILHFYKSDDNLPFVTQSKFFNSSDGVILTLADGKNINIDTVLLEGIRQNNALIKFSGNGLTYVPYQNTSDQEYNTLTTSFGKQSFIKLPDGSKVWLNACSSILFPTAFDNKKRKVQLIGEAFFEVTTLIDSTLASAKIPFIVELKNGNYINVTGTEFNITAYDDGEIKATLIEGGIEVQNSNYTKKIVPGEQAIINSSGGITISHIKDANETYSWKEGMFNYNDVPIEQVMEDISRWYHVSVEYKQYISNHLTITVPRAISLNNLLDLLEMNSSVHFEISGKKVIVST